MNPDTKDKSMSKQIRKVINQTVFEFFNFYRSPVPVTSAHIHLRSSVIANAM